MKEEAGYPGFFEALNRYFKATRFFREARKIGEELEKHGITKYDIHTDLSVTVDGNVNLSGLYLSECPFNFRKVTGEFNITFNNYTSLKGVPKVIGGNFVASHNKIESLEFGPEEVGGDYIINPGESVLPSLRSPLKKLGGYFKLFSDTPHKIKEFEQYYENNGLYIKLELINNVYSAIDLSEKLNNELPVKEEIPMRRNKI